MSLAELEEVLEQHPNKVNLFLAGVSVGQLGALQLQKHIEIHPRLTVLELRGSSIGHQGCLHLARAFKLHPCISHIGLARNGVDSGAVVTLLKALVDTSLHTLDLEWNGLDSSVAFSLSELLRAETCSLVAVTLERNDIAYEGAVELARALQQNTTLRNLNLAFNRCGTRGATAMGEMLCDNGTLLTLNLCTNDILSEGARSIVDALCTNSTLRSINLQGNQAFSAFGERGKNLTYSDALKELNLFGNRMNTIASAKGFGESLQEARSIIALSIAKSQAGDAFMQPVLNGVSFMVALVTLDVSHCSMSRASMPSMSDVVSTCTNMQTLILDDNHIDAAGAIALAVGLVHTTALTHLSVSGCMIHSEGIKAIADAFDKRRGLPIKQLHLARNGIDTEGVVALCEVLLQDDALEVLDLASNQVSGRACAVLTKLLERHRLLSAVTVRDNILADLVRVAYLNLEKASEYLAANDVEAGAAALPQSTSLNVSTAPSFAPKVAAVPTSTIVSNFNSSSLAWHRSMPAVSVPVPTPESSYARTTNAALVPVPVPKMPRRDNVAVIVVDDDADDAPPLADGSRCGTALSPEVKRERFRRGSPDMSVIGLASVSHTPFSQRRVALNDFESNIGGFCISETQLRLKFAEWDKQCQGFITVYDFRNLYSGMEIVALPSDDKKLAALVKKYSKNDGKIFFDEFCIMMLQLVGR
jgi:Ran GTPase-activating protein (RanGAP) involved in mRNA processing and transport